MSQLQVEISGARISYDQEARVVRGDAAERCADKMRLDPGSSSHPVAKNERVPGVISIGIGASRCAVAVSMSAQIGAENNITLSGEGERSARPCMAGPAAARRKYDCALIGPAELTGDERAPVK